MTAPNPATTPGARWQNRYSGQISVVAKHYYSRALGRCLVMLRSPAGSCNSMHAGYLAEHYTFVDFGEVSA